MKNIFGASATRPCLISTSTWRAPDKAMTAVVTGAELYLPLAGLIDIAQEIARLEKELQSLAWRS